MKQKTYLFRIVSLLLAILLLASAASAALSYGSEWNGYTATDVVSYSDVPKNFWAYDAIQRVSAQNWFSGYPDGSFRPSGTITRAEALKVFVMFLGLEVKPVTTTSFYDVSVSKWYAPYIEAGKDLFPTRMSVQGKIPFQPDMPVTREDTIYALVNALGFGNDLSVVDQSTLNMFKDQDSISSNIRAHFAVALQNGLVSGYPDNTIRARNTLTRAEFATLLNRGTYVGFQDTNTAKISTVSISPSSPIKLKIGETATLTARATYTDGSNKPYNDLKPYDDSNNGVISLSGASIIAKKEGTSTIKFSDNYLKNESVVIIVSAPTDAPTLKITDYPDQTENNNVTISGTISDANISEIDLTCNGKDVAIGGGNFSVTVSLAEGSNSFTFVATNKYGVKTEKRISIVKTTSSPASASSPVYVRTDEFGVPFFEDFIGKEPFSVHSSSDSSKYYAFDSWGIDVDSIIDDYFNCLYDSEFILNAYTDENGMKSWEFWYGCLTKIEFINDYSLAHIEISIQYYG